MSSTMTKPDTSLWDQQRNKIVSKKGGWFVGDGIYCHGYDMMDELVGKVSYMQVVMLNATGRLPERHVADWFEAVHICLSWPDSRIWCNHIGALGGTMRASAVASTVAGVLATDSRSYGIKPLKEGVAFIQAAMASLKGGLSVEAIVVNECEKHGGKPYIMGYARPIAKGDERVLAMELVAKNLDFSDGEHLKLAYDIDRELLARFNEGMNINGYMSAFLSDQHFTPEEVYRICATLVASGVSACYVDMRDRPAETFLPLRCDDIDFQGKPHRTL
ncbi:MAG: hypothetical protein COB71_00825 [Thiotrichales bacterium]|nr:MAG: hypothetical protein COB71_00825 [Thiotrichales bacterium]